jgi:glycosyltransferase involved in cell wall biosynthesis
MKGKRRNPVVVDARVVVGSGGGPEKTILNSPRFLEPAGYRNLCVYLRAPNDPGFEALRVRAREWGAPLVEIADRGALDLGVVVSLLNLCRREKVAIWHGHDYKTNALGLLLNRFWPMRLATTVHGWVQHTRRTPLYYAIDRLCLPRYECVLCVSADLRDECLAVGVPADRCVLLENGIDLGQYSRRTELEAAKARFGVPPGRRVLGAVGRLSAEKGFDRLIRATAELLRRGRDVELWIAGAGDESAALARLAAELGVAERVKLLGFRSDTIDLYEAMDVFVLSSLREGLPNVMLEAMALMAPTVATRIAGVPALIQDGVSGLLVRPGEEGELAEAIDRLLGSEPLRRQIAAEARGVIERRYSFAARMEYVRQVYDHLLGRAPVAHTALVSERGKESR